MSTAQNGWPVLPFANARTFLAPNGKLVYCAPNAATVLGYVAWNWHLRVERLGAATYNEGDPRVRQGHVVIHALRPAGYISGTKVLSIHGTGLAMDIYGDRHPYEYDIVRAGRRYYDGFTQAQRDELRAIKADLRNFNGGADCLRLGIDFPSPRRDGMHVELWITATQLSRTAQAIRNAGWNIPTKRGQIAEYQKIVGVEADDFHGNGTIAAVKAYQKNRGLPQTGVWDFATNRTVVPPPQPILRLGSKGDLVKKLQKFALDYFWSYAQGIKHSGGADGVFGEGTEAWVKQFQKRTGLTPDGVVGDDTMNKLKSNGFKP